MTPGGDEMAISEYEVFCDPTSFGGPIHMVQQNTTCQVEIPVSARRGFRTQVTLPAIHFTIG